MAKNKQRQETETVEQELKEVQTSATEEQQAVENSEKFAETVEVTPEDNQVEDVKVSDVKATEPKQKSGGKAIAVLALLVALGIGGAGYWFGHQKFDQMEQYIATLKKNSQLETNVVIPNFEQEKAQIAQLVADYQQSQQRVSQLEREQASYTQQINTLKEELQKLGTGSKVDKSQWLLSDADFLLNNALRKVVLDNDIDTARSLLIEADNVLSQVTDQRVLAIRDAIKMDLNQLNSVNQVDQNNVMQRLSQLANLVDDMPMVDDGSDTEKSAEVSDSIEDWQKNIEKSADSFLSHFIRVSDKNTQVDKGFIAPNQEIYLRENIRLRLQIAILTVPRQQNELYKQSLEAVSTWVRSYFDVNNDNVKTFLKDIDDLIDQSIYIDAPNRLQSLVLLDQLLNKASKPIAKIQLDEDKALEQLETKVVEETDAKQPVVNEQAQPVSQSVEQKGE